MKFADPLIRDAFLMRAAPEVVYEWLHEAATAEADSLWGEILPKAIIAKLGERSEPLIDLALASYSNDAAQLKRLFATGDPALRIAVLKNKLRARRFHWGPDPEPWLTLDEFRHFCANAEGNELAAYFASPGLSGDALASVFDREGLYAELTDDRWWLISALAVANPKANGPEPDMLQYDDDGPGWYTACKPQKRMWQVFLQVPTTDMYAYLLWNSLNASSGGEYRGSNLLGTLERWMPPAQTENDPEITGQVPADADRRANERTGEYFADLREQIAAMVPRGLKNVVRDHEDIAVRRGYYRSPAFEMSSDEIEECYRRDGASFLDAIWRNDKLYLYGNFKEWCMVHRLVGDSRADESRSLRGCLDRRRDHLEGEDPLRYLCPNPVDVGDRETMDRERLAATVRQMASGENLEKLLPLFLRLITSRIDRVEGLCVTFGSTLTNMAATVASAQPHNSPRGWWK